jgi:hypothetical protein
MAGAGVIAVSLICSGLCRHARRHPAPLISLSLFKTHTFSVGIAGNLATRLGTGCVPFLMPLMLQVGFGYPAIIAGCMIAHRYRLDYCEIYRYPGAALVWLS